MNTTIFERVHSQDEMYKTLDDNVMSLCKKIDAHIYQIWDFAHKDKLVLSDLVGRIHDMNYTFNRDILIPSYLDLFPNNGYKWVELKDDEHFESHPIDLLKSYQVYLEDLFNFDICDGLYKDPASSKYHGNFFGGLYLHNLIVYKNCLLSARLYGIKEYKVSLIACMLHDACKIGKYKLPSELEYKHWNDEILNKDISFEYDKNGIEYKNSIQRGPESVRKILNLIYLTWDNCKTFYNEYTIFKNEKKGTESYIIRPDGQIRNDLYSMEWEQAVAYHMGLFDCSDTDVKSFSNITEYNPLVLMLHNADMMATKFYKI